MAKRVLSHIAKIAVTDLNPIKQIDFYLLTKIIFSS